MAFSKPYNLRERVENITTVQIKETQTDNVPVKTRGQQTSKVINIMEETEIVGIEKNESVTNYVIKLKRSKIPESMASQAKVRKYFEKKVLEQERE